MENTKAVEIFICLLCKKDFNALRKSDRGIGKYLNYAYCRDCLHYLRDKLESGGVFFNFREDIIMGKVEHVD